jgi:hypothetical protein
VLCCSTPFNRRQLHLLRRLTQYHLLLCTTCFPLFDGLFLPCQVLASYWVIENTTALHATPVFVNLVNAAILNWTAGGSITVNSQPFAITAQLRGGRVQQVTLPAVHAGWSDGFILQMISITPLRLPLCCSSSSPSRSFPHPLLFSWSKREKSTRSTSRYGAFWTFAPLHCRCSICALHRNVCS